MATAFRASRSSESTFRLILVPALISLVVTLWRLTGELLAWSESWFNPEAGGLWAVIGITWLVPLVGGYFATKLSENGEMVMGWIQTLGVSSLGVLILFGAGVLPATLYQANSYVSLSYKCVIAVVAAGVVYPAWPHLFRTLVVYGLAARLPVIVIMFLAIWGQWGTHYDAVPKQFPETAWLTRFLLSGLLPQTFFWVSFTVVVGMFFGALVVGWAHRGRGRARTV